MDDVSNLNPWQEKEFEVMRNVSAGIVFVVELALNIFEPLFGQKVHPALHLIVLLPLVVSAVMAMFIKQKI